MELLHGGFIDSPFLVSKFQRNLTELANVLSGDFLKGTGDDRLCQNCIQYICVVDILRPLPNAKYSDAFRQVRGGEQRITLPDRPLFVVTGSTTSFAKRRALRDKLRNSKNGILLCTQQSLPSSVNFEFVNKVLIPELHYNNSGMSQFYMRFVRYTSTQLKEIFFLTYAGSIESNQMQMVLAKEKLNLFMKGQDTDLDAIYEKFDVNYDLLSLLMRREQDKEGKFHIRWGEQKIA